MIEPGPDVIRGLPVVPRVNDIRAIRGIEVFKAMVGRELIRVQSSCSPQHAPFPFVLAEAGLYQDLCPASRLVDGFVDTWWYRDEGTDWINSCADAGVEPYARHGWSGHNYVVTLENWLANPTYYHFDVECAVDPPIRRYVGDSPGVWKEMSE